jgi:plasmid stability protein
LIPWLSAPAPKQVVINAIIDHMMQAQPGEPAPMSSITIRNLDPAIKERLRIRAAEHGHSMEAEARHILQAALKARHRRPKRTLYERIRARFAPMGGVDDLELPPREADRDPPRLGKPGHDGGVSVSVNAPGH